MLSALMLLIAAAAITALPQEQVVSSFVTPLEGRSSSQRHNAVLAAERLNGAVVKPGEVFSFNRRVGTFSRDAGYRKAPVSYNGQLIDDWGGGVCQTSTTLYNTALLGGMEIVERNRHRFAPSYVPPGRDAAVAYTNIDLRFRNPHRIPIRIAADVVGEKLTISFVAPEGIGRRPVIVQEVRKATLPAEFRIGEESSRAWVRNTGKPGFEVSVYRITGEQRERISFDTYPVTNRIVEFLADR